MSDNSLTKQMTTKGNACRACGAPIRDGFLLCSLCWGKDNENRRSDEPVVHDVAGYYPPDEPKVTHRDLLLFFAQYFEPEALSNPNSALAHHVRLAKEAAAL